MFHLFMPSPLPSPLPSPSLYIYICINAVHFICSIFSFGLNSLFSVCIREQKQLLQRWITIGIGLFPLDAILKPHFCQSGRRKVVGTGAPWLVNMIKIFSCMRSHSLEQIYNLGHCMNSVFDITLQCYPTPSIRNFSLQSLQSALHLHGNEKYSEN